MIKVRKGLFETSSSSEDSLSIYQDMRLFILPEVEYKKFLSGNLYVRFDGVHPSYTDDFDRMLKENDSAFATYKIPTISDYPKSVQNMYGSTLFSYMDKLYIDYKTYLKAINMYYSESNHFDYTDSDNIIFGFYGYTRD